MKTGSYYDQYYLLEETIEKIGYIWVSDLQGFRSGLTKTSLLSHRV